MGFTGQGLLLPGSWFPDLTDESDVGGQLRGQSPGSDALGLGQVTSYSTVSWARQGSHP